MHKKRTNCCKVFRVCQRTWFARLKYRNRFISINTRLGDGEESSSLRIQIWHAKNMSVHHFRFDQNFKCLPSHLVCSYCAPCAVDELVIYTSINRGARYKYICAIWINRWNNIIFFFVLANNKQLKRYDCSKRHKNIECVIFPITK